FGIRIGVAAEIMHAHAQQTYRTGARVRFFEQSYGTRGQLRLVARGERRVAAGDGREIAVTHFDGDRAREQLTAQQPPDRVRGQFRDLRADDREVGEIFRIGRLGS